LLGQEVQILISEITMGNHRHLTDIETVAIPANEKVTYQIQSISNNAVVTVTKLLGPESSMVFESEAAVVIDVNSMPEIVPKMQKS
jgi:hypothetical protein